MPFSLSGGIICGPLRGSFAVRDHLRSNLGIISGLGIICGAVQIFSLLCPSNWRLLFLSISSWDSFSALKMLVSLLVWRPWVLLFRPSGAFLFSSPPSDVLSQLFVVKWFPKPLLDHYICDINRPVKQVRNRSKSHTFPLPRLCPPLPNRILTTFVTFRLLWNLECVWKALDWFLSW